MHALRAHGRREDPPPVLKALTIRMEIRVHPNFEKSQSRYLFRCLLFFLIALLLSYLLLDKSQSAQNIVNFSLLIGSVAACYYGAFIRPKNVICPECFGQTDHGTKEPEGFMIAECRRCSISWNLGYRFAQD